MRHLDLEDLPITAARLRAVKDADVHVSTITFDLPYDVVWDWLSDPLRFPVIYPNWTAEVSLIKDKYLALAPDGEKMMIKPVLDRVHGVIDFQVDATGNVELSRSRLFETGDGRCTLVHLAVRWEGLDDVQWREHRLKTDHDLEIAKHQIESRTAPPAQNATAAWPM